MPLTPAHAALGRKSCANSCNAVDHGRRWGTPNGLRGLPRGIAVGLGHAAVGGMAALAVALVIFGLVGRPPEDPGTAA
jgi:hypothetical protein